MNTSKYLSTLPQFLVLVPSAISCYFAVHGRMKYTFFQTVALCLAVLLPYSLLGTWLCTILHLDANAIFLPSLVLFFFLYRRTVALDLARCLAVYIGVCAVQSFPVQFAYAFDAFRYPKLGASEISIEAACIQLGLSCLIAAAFAYPACHWFSPAVDRLDYPKIWYSTVILSLIFLLFNILSVPQSYATLHAGRLLYLFPLLEICMLAVLITIYVLFYQGAMMIVERTELKEQAQLFEMQSRQYRTLKEHMRQTAILRHDFRHSVRLLSSLAEKGDIDSIRMHLAGYENSLSDHTIPDYCANAALNALFGYYHETAISAKINTNWHIQLPDPLPITELDLASLLGNLMENAIDGCLTVPEGNRYFCLTTELCRGSQLYIVSTNNFDGTVRKRKDGYHSTKHSGKGTGLVSISAIAEKYNGSLQISNSDREFFADVILKM